jgi:curved DNA-binding protein CbpA
MAPNDDPKGYYRILGLACNASHAQIVHAYREWAKKYHPDVNKTGDASNFVRMKDAYDILSDPSRRRAYDSSTHGDTSAYPQRSPEADKEAKEPPDHEIDAVRCCHCGVISAQPRYCVFHRVISFFFYTHTAEIRGVYCAECARRRSLKESAICWLLGWWSIVGVFQTPVALLTLC